MAQVGEKILIILYIKDVKLNKDNEVIHIINKF